MSQLAFLEVAEKKPRRQREGHRWGLVGRRAGARDPQGWGQRGGGREGSQKGKAADRGKGVCPGEQSQLGKLLRIHKWKGNGESCRHCLKRL